MTVLLETILREYPQGIGEYELMKKIEAAAPDFLPSHSEGSLALFQKHFVLMNALYKLQDVLQIQGQYLSISPITIKIEKDAAEKGGQISTDSVAGELREYYLDLTNLEATGAKEVNALMGAFWGKYFAADKYDAALAVLGLAGSPKWSQIKQSYQRLAGEHHPDRGGDKVQFIAIREAYENLKIHYGQ